ncbi:MAG TPA: non-canonical purine NTP pyrophosphatase [bacterium]|nr:non-canonical purine NTP pyrophosphatase [bacterium]
MKEIIFGTSNPAKLAQIQGVLESLGIKVRSIAEFGDVPDVEENGKTALENAKIKALAYAKAIGQIVFSMDNALYIEGLPDDKQPGVHTRRIPGVEGKVTDDQMREYYAALVESHGGEMANYWEFGIVVADSDGIIAETVARTPNRILTSKVCPESIPGYPLESLQKDPESGKYLAEMSEDERAEFWRSTIGAKVEELFKSLELREGEVGDRPKLV